jgi:hypothetical protein
MSRILEKIHVGSEKTFRIHNTALRYVRVTESGPQDWLKPVL